MLENPDCTRGTNGFLGETKIPLRLRLPELWNFGDMHHPIGTRNFNPVDRRLLIRLLGAQFRRNIVQTHALGVPRQTPDSPPRDALGSKSSASHGADRGSGEPAGTMGHPFA